MEILLTKQKTAAGSKTIKIGNLAPDSYPAVPVTLYLLGASLAGGESVKVQFYDAGATTWRDMYLAETLQALTTTNNVMTIYGPLEFRVYKTTTAADIGVGISMVRGLTL